MNYQEAFQVSASGMAVERTRLELAAANIAAMNTPGRDEGSVYRPLHLVAQTEPLRFAAQFGQLALVGGGGVRIESLVSDSGAPRLAYEPGHPYANAKGYVAYPAVNQVSEMLDVNVALRSYEANVAAMNAARVMLARTLDIGSGQ